MQTEYANYRTLAPMTDEQLRAAAPSIFAESPEEGVSDRYGFIPTGEVVAALRKEGFVPTYAAQCMVKDKLANKEYAKHMLRFTLASDLAKVGNVPSVVGGEAHHFFEDTPEIAQITVVNSHDRSSGYQLDAALWRLLCSNGLMVGGSAFQSIHVRHSKGVVGRVIEGSYRIIDEMPQIFERVAEMKRIELNPTAQRAFAETAAAIRWSDAVPVDPQRLLNVRRDDDNLPDLWTTYNVVQENLMRGGVGGRAVTGRKLTTRAINSVTEDVRLNRALWVVADSMREAALH